MSAFHLRFDRKIAVAITGLSMLVVFSSIAEAENLNAGAVMQKMSGGDRYSFVAGIVEGLAIARYAQDGKKPDGMNCIYDWFYKDPKALDNIYAAFGHFPDYPPGSVVDALARKKCA